jgi:general secretion pathway protein I
MAIGSVLATTTLGVRSLEQHLRLVQIARSVVAGVPLDNPLAFRSLSGETEGFRWKIVASPFLAEPQKQASESSWVPMKLSIEVRSPAGASFQLETIRLQRGVTN